jgi:hypothetical protein
VDSTSKTFTSSLATTTPCPENIFTFEPAKDYNRSECHFGDTFYIRVHSSLSSSPLYLVSEPISLTTSLKAKQQPLKLSQHKCADALWSAELKDVSVRFEAHGQAILGDAEVVLVHKATGQLLHSDAAVGRAAQFPVTVHTGTNGAKRHGLLLEQRGSLLPDAPMHPEPVANAWALLLGTPK